MPSSTTSADNRRTGKLLFALITRLHFYIGLFIGPFLLIAALSGIAYALTPQLESWLYHDALTAESDGTSQPLSRQIEVAQQASGQLNTPAAVRPAPPGGTTRVMFSGEEYGSSEHRALFVDPVTLAIKGDMAVYGTSGVLPLRTLIDQFHRSLLLGDVGRLYSELAASWLWLVALGGLVLWARSRVVLRAQVGSGALRRRHATLGAIAFIGLLFFSATGLTWSQWAGGNIAELRHAWGWGTPSVSTDLTATAPDSPDAHANHGSGGSTAHAQDFQLTLTDFDRAYTAARQAGIDADAIELIPPSGPQRAWKIREIDRSWPTQVDQVALDPHSMAVTDRADFVTFPLAAKLTRWGIDLHMGTLFGLPNQLALAAFASGLATLVCWGYTMWWRRRSYAVANGQAQTLTMLFVRLSWLPRFVILAVAVALGLALPVMGGSLALLVVIDVLRWVLAQRHAKVTSQTL
ncbi:hypothetical protein L861_13795 [Litchfieldella anticariensis FP35 = DSM 16096]|uniref:PepSY domain-containing protein n=1 Tax=Litchfieldella anticariensis (strain DSM 16096 / CECT 5854 / CIP 108499 / LMG 22089 / FP35) TaxID=1121939 RepID=S2KKA3_LITA3|nr:PepSY-associated TM helix domain-containing protein [Halomonas anticariensis]EPC00858.1 hypothetical protein L861_13795 [Halomonas anticariensis FP35 = DSM 16096]